MSVYEKLMTVQSKLKAPKGQYNSFGKYNYRSCEDILTAVKPILAEAKAIIVIGDSIEPVGNRIYVKATAKFIDTESGESVENSALAREEDAKKGMDGSQITGTASSYARKYCLNGLLLIDDTKDADTDEYVKRTTQDTAKALDKEPTTTAKPHTVTSVFVCKRCNRSIDSDVHSYSVKYCGESLCRDCQKKFRNGNVMHVK